MEGITMKKLFAILLAALMLLGLAACGANAMSDAKGAYLSLIHI